MMIYRLWLIYLCIFTVVVCMGIHNGDNTRMHFVQNNFTYEVSA